MTNNFSYQKDFLVNSWGVFLVEFAFDSKDDYFIGKSMP